MAAIKKRWTEENYRRDNVHANNFFLILAERLLAKVHREGGMASAEP